MRPDSFLTLALYKLLLLAYLLAYLLWLRLGLGVNV